MEKFVTGKTGETPRKTYRDSVSSTTKPTWSDRDVGHDVLKREVLQLFKEEEHRSYITCEHGLNLNGAQKSNIMCETGTLNQNNIRGKQHTLCNFRFVLLHY